MLSDREKFILHFCCALTIAKITRMQNHSQVLETIIEDVRQNRCRSLAPEDIADLLMDVNGEMMSGKIMFNHLIEDSTIKQALPDKAHPHFSGSMCWKCLRWSMTGERPKKNNWKDMR